MPVDRIVERIVEVEKPVITERVVEVERVVEKVRSINFGDVTRASGVSDTSLCWQCHIFLASSFFASDLAWRN